MTSNTLTACQASPRRRSTFIASPADAAAKRTFVAIITAAVVVSVASVGAVTPLFF